MADSVDLDKTSSYELSHLNMHYLQSYVYWSVGMKGLNEPSGMCIRTIL